MNHVHVLGETNGPLDAGLLFVAQAPGRLGALARAGAPAARLLCPAAPHTMSCR